MRKMQASDKHNYLRMATDFYNSDAVIKAIPQETLESVFDDIIGGSPYVESWLIENDEGKVAGYALLVRSFSQEAGGRVLWLDELYIDPAFRSQGLARKFIHFMKQNYAHKVKRIRLDVEAENELAVALYEKMGFKPLPYMQMVLDIP